MHWEELRAELAWMRGDGPEPTWGRPLSRAPVVGEPPMHAWLRQHVLGTPGLEITALDPQDVDLWAGQEGR
jgi:hypothetical protein